MPQTVSLAWGQGHYNRFSLSTCCLVISSFHWWEGFSLVVISHISWQHGGEDEHQEEGDRGAGHQGGGGGCLWLGCFAAVNSWKYSGNDAKSTGVITLAVSPILLFAIIIMSRITITWSRWCPPGTGVVTSVHSGVVPFHRLPSMQPRGAGLGRNAFSKPF